MRIQNPIIPGFHPDPSICRVGDDFYLVTSSFEYFPGVPVFHSRDLVNWRQVGHCLTRHSQLPLANARASGGIYAPTLRYHNGWFYMITTNVTDGGHFYVRTQDPAGEWSEPFWLPGGGIDPSLLFDEDGQVYFTYTSGGIVQRLIDAESGQSLSDERPLWAGTGGQWPEGPHLYHIGDWYYLLISEGGTEYGHMLTIARSHSPWGPFEACPTNPILTHRSTNSPIQATGHGDLVQSPDGRWWMVFLGIRPHGHWPCHNLGRETFLAPVTWEDGWPLVGKAGVAEGERVPLADELPGQVGAPEALPEVFQASGLGMQWNFLRNLEPDCWSFDASTHCLRLMGRAPGLDEAAALAWVGRRQLDFEDSLQVELRFEPRDEHEEAGLVVWMNERHHYEIYVTLRGGKRVLAARRRIGSLSAEVGQVVAPEGPLLLKVSAITELYQLLWGAPGSALQTLAAGETRYLATETAGGFTGVYFACYATGNGQICQSPAVFTL